MNEVPESAYEPFIPKPMLDAFYWRLLARAKEATGDLEYAVLYWDRFLHHGAHEKLFTPESLEAALIYRRMATLVGQYAPDDLKAFLKDMWRGKHFSRFYKSAPPEVASLDPSADQSSLRNSLDPNWLFRRSVEIDPDPTTFTDWLAWGKAANLPDKALQELAEVWRRMLPTDTRPLLLLSAQAEERNALTLALKHLADAEAIDAMSPAVRRARVRLTLGIAWRHLREKKAHLLEKDVRELQAMPALREGDRAAFVLLLGAAANVLGNDPTAAREACDAAVEKVGPLLRNIF